jgi:diguanylate cyclase (GGDEF)-like protein
VLVVVENLEELAERYGEELGEQAPRYIAAALEPGLRGFDSIGRPSTHELLIVLPGAGGARAELVARRALERLRTIKVEAQGIRIPLRISLGLAGWENGTQAADLLASARLAARGGEIAR